MSRLPPINTLNQWLSDSNAALKVQKQRLQELQDADPNILTEADERQIGASMATTVRECNEHLLVLEQIDNPSIQEREVMDGLNKLVNSGDELQYAVAMFRDQLREKRKGSLKASKPLLDDGMRKAARAARLAASTSTSGMATPALAAIKINPAGSPIPVVASETISEQAVPDNNLPNSSVQSVSKAAATTMPATKAHSLSQLPVATNLETAVEALALDDKQFSCQDEAEEPLNEDPRDPLGLYVLLAVTPDAPMADIKKAIRKRQIALHPDRSSDPDANSKFADFNKIMECFADERKRAEYDATGKVEELKDLGKRMRVLTASAA